MFRYSSNGRIAPINRVMRAMPDDILDDVVAAYVEDRFERHRRAAKAKPAKRREITALIRRAFLCAVEWAG